MCVLVCCFHKPVHGYFLEMWSLPLPYIEPMTLLLQVMFQTNEGDTPKNAYSLRGGNWMHSERGKIPLAWGVDPLIAMKIPALWNYYALTASANDTFFAACGGFGYSYPWRLPDLEAYMDRSRVLQSAYMPRQNNWVDVWESGLNASAYTNYFEAARGSIAAFSQQTTGIATNTCINNTIPVFMAQGGDSETESLWYVHLLFESYG